jgi:predicted MPP superfamily phosphohydrolase
MSNVLPEHSEPAVETVYPTREALWQKRIAIEEVRERHHRRRMAKSQREKPVDEGDLIAFVLKSVGLWARGRRNAVEPVLREIDFHCPGLPPRLDGFTLLQMTDLHFYRGFEWLDPLKEVVRSAEADVCVLTGDYRFYHWGPCDIAVEGMKRLLPAVRTRHGTYAILGNHDTYRIVEPYRALGIRWLLNDNVTLRHNGEEVHFAGIDDNHGYRSHSLPLALEGLPDDGFRILLAHSPAIADEASESGVDLCLCGHTHAGQIRFPFVGPLFLNAPRTPRRVCSGTWRHGNTQGYTSAGLGSTGAPVRFNCPPEAALIRLRSI